MDQLVGLGLIGHIQAAVNIIPVGIHIIGVIRLIQGRGHIQVLDVLVVGIQSLGGGIHDQFSQAVVRDLALEEGVGLLHILADVRAIFIHELLSQIGHLIVSGRDGEIGGVSVLHAVLLLHAILEIGGVVQLDIGVVTVFLAGVQLHVIGILNGAVVELVLIGGGPAQGAAIGIHRNAACNRTFTDFGATVHIGHLVAHGVHDHGGNAGGQLGKGGVQRFGILGVDVLAVALDHPFQIRVVQGKAHGVHVAVEAAQLVGAVVISIILAVGQQDQHLLGHGAMILVQQVDAQIYTLHDVGAAIGNHIIQAGFRLGIAGKRDVLNVSARGQRILQCGHCRLGRLQTGLIVDPFAVLVLILAGQPVGSITPAALNLVSGFFLRARNIVGAGRIDELISIRAKNSIFPRIFIVGVAPPVGGIDAVVPSSIILDFIIFLMHVAALVVVRVGAPHHGAGLIQDEHHVQGLLLDGGLADVGLYGDLPLGVAHPLGGLAQGDVVAVFVSDGLGLEGVVLLAIGGEGADLDQAEGHDHSHEQGKSSAAKALERIRSFLQSFVSHYFVLLLIFFAGTEYWRPGWHGVLL